jgi:subtilisin-like proprotein convertase family protein
MGHRSTYRVAARDPVATATVLAALVAGVNTAPAHPAGPDTPAIVLNGDCVSVVPADVLDWTSVCNTTPITLPASGAASPYPSEISIAGLTGVTAQIRVRLLEMTHAFSEDIDVLLTNPFGFVATILSDTGTGAATGVDLDLQPGAPAFLPRSGPLGSGQFRPTDYLGEGIAYPAPAPPFDFDGIPYNSSFAGISGSDPNGTWRLWVRDDFAPDAGTIAGGWCLDIATVAAPLGCPPGGLAGTIQAGDPSWPGGRPNRNGVPSNCLSPKACSLEPLAPGTFRYDSLNGVNLGDSTACMTLTLHHGGSATCPAGAFLSVYSAPPDFDDPCAAYLADAGSSPNPTTGMGVPLSLSLAPGQGFVVLIHEAVAGTAGCSWGLWIEGDDCPAVDYPVFLDGFDNGDAGAWSVPGL